MDNQLNVVDTVKDVKDEAKWKAVEELNIELDSYAANLKYRQMDFFDRLRNRQRPKLIWWKRIVWGTAVIRIICCLVILVSLLFYRYSYLDPLVPKSWQSNLTSVSYNLIFVGLLMMCFLCLVAIYLDVLVCIAAQNQHPQKMMMAFSVAQAAVFMICFMGCFSAGAAKNIDEVTATIFGNRVNLATASSRVTFYKYQVKHKCCGAYGPKDWLKLHFFAWGDYAENQNYYILNTMDWMAECRLYNLTCAVPLSCCAEGSSCWNGSATERTYLNEMISAGAARNSEKMELLAEKFDQQGYGVHPYGCYMTMNAHGKYVLTIVGWFVFILCLMTTIMVLLMIAGLLYNSAIGNVDAENFSVIPATTDFLVWFFMYLDGLTEPDDFTLTDFSIIEELKRLDIDDRLQDDLTEREADSV